MKLAAIVMMLVGFPLALTATAPLPAVLGGLIGGLGVELLLH